MALLGKARITEEAYQAILQTNQGRLALVYEKPQPLRVTIDEETDRIRVLRGIKDSYGILQEVLTYGRTERRPTLGLTLYNYQIPRTFGELRAARFGITNDYKDGLLIPEARPTPDTTDEVYKEDIATRMADLLRYGMPQERPGLAAVAQIEELPATAIFLRREIPSLFFTQRGLLSGAVFIPVRSYAEKGWSQGIAFPLVTDLDIDYVDFVRDIFPKVIDSIH